MWYFSWILGTGLACAFAILNALWLELRVNEKPLEENKEKRV
ncbi:cyd operon protein YbgT [Legionella micdadei]|uniref:Cyd operon protein YbgT n=1 Tax=Legionella micdadei TaxID=451 RepID=A0A098GAJ2_LEGMI|nr:cyd operon protein YbgT [Legionella micdadei]ARG99021.1 cyd operon protein YbgT [Legionella micdadei]NSL17293.1 cytochrome bd-I oxidase subunit CydX [Legionella micdadei]CEG59448.1 Cyd operon protein YbgT [Legionella micdadei]SCX90249.1 cyd operon protein YbgT [Legionella micdadei]